MKKFAFLLAIFPFLIVVGSISCAPKYTPSVSINVNESIIRRTDRERAIIEAQKIFVKQKAEGVDMSAGPCLSNEIIPDWVADVAHWPRQEVDDDPANQCSAFREGKAHHFVELDTDGNFIRAY